MTATTTIDVQALYPKLVNLLLDTVFVVDESGYIAFVSDASQQLLGYRPDEMIGRPIQDYIHPDDREATLAAARNIIAGRTHTDFENRYIAKDGRVVHILWSARWHEEERLRIAVARDITTLRRANQTRDALYRISEAAHDADTLKGLCNGVRKVVADLFPEDELTLAFYDSDKRSLRVPDWQQERSDGWLEKSIEAGTALADILSSQQPMIGERADWLGIPLITRHTVLGILTLEKTLANATFDDKDQELLDFVATQVASMVERKQADEELRFLAHHDPLTGLSNRSLFNERLEDALETARCNGTRLAVLYVDLNDFKQVNDTWGHDAGDNLIREVGRRLVSSTRGTDTIGRMGGDEFTVLLTDIAGAPDVVDKAVQKIRDLMSTPMMIEGKPLIMSCSIGTAVYPEDGDTARKLMIKADTNMYVNKYGA